MAAFDHGIKIIASQAGRQLARLAGLECQHWEPAESTVQATVEKLADRVFRAGRGKERFVVYFEFLTTWDAEAPWDILAKSGMLSKREKLPTWAVAVILSRAGYKPQRGRLRLSVGGTTVQGVRFKEVPLWKIKPQAWWEKVPGLMALYPLCRHRREPQEAIVHAAGAIEKRVPGPIERADALTILSIFSKLGYPDLDPHTIIGREKMRESKFYQEILEEGRHEGEVNTSRAHTLAALEARFGKSGVKKVSSAVNAISDLAELERLFHLALRCERLDEFRKALPD